MTAIGGISRSPARTGDALDQAIDRVSTALVTPTPDPLFAERILAALPDRRPAWFARPSVYLPPLAAGLAMLAAMVVGRGPTGAGDLHPVSFPPVPLMGATSHTAAARVATTAIVPGVRARQEARLASEEPDSAVPPIRVHPMPDVAALDVAPVALSDSPIVGAMTIPDLAVSALRLAEDMKE
jgi:hypothetical protein